MRRGMTIGWGTVAARVFSAASGAVLVVVLAGCSSGDSAQEASSGIATHSAPADSQPTDPSNNPPHDDPPAFHFESGDLVLGDFTYEDVAGNIFNPCEEISAEEFAAIGFEKKGHVIRDRDQEKVACRLSLLSDSTSGYRGLMAGPVAFSQVAEQTDIYELNASTKVPNVYTNGPTDSEVGLCYASVDTVRGQLSAVATREDDSGCSVAVQIIEQLYNL